ncbi:ribosomal L7Ae/L30e/S12e/Gadd45 family protein [Tuanshanicoccus lijuaniae]|uniref:L7Ae/L30e/S12e/Gadd45 family ribosomal protein n=1 Tax=Aerococcaceae bacterium zg-1292 TaxID=2774330 RepID=UPI0019355F5E|nr:ribosomal L7Ae/L30e/S12e/Gadd45 family protein [Aerococcaceae bacterium zg-1292]MBF6626531.1 ribosomal L7Ae/L30e/S12e/Gadd45 family protein [Aerococcaceae bacterium zg-BR9]MBS4455861.1 ribosomal L7Ae/L30e/S12e/Gadd45 family protein [Aerococcaceae bacterium zg-A91]MBS4457601.1 ribosomal L7Ae/L30e/S12e/Gadd45 family protein [Aerococcaceae bacterium zg-BR33]QQA37987.1 ribosomal L7Ae/L30e/S12e/Gadd45 family protein [Aerococcaceae bacterium zg-1292]
MTPEQKKLNLLGLAMRARQLVSGDELVEKAVKNGSVKLVVCAKDASVATLERYSGFCQRNNIPLNTEFTRDEISHAVGKSRTIVGLTNHGMIKTFLGY